MLALVARLLGLLEHGCTIVLLSYPNYHIESLTHFFIDNHPSIYAFIRAAFLNYIFLLSCMLTYDTTEK